MSANEQAKKIVSSNTGWHDLTSQLGVTVPKQLRTSQQAREAVRRLIRTGR